MSEPTSSATATVEAALADMSAEVSVLHSTVNSLQVRLAQEARRRATDQAILWRRIERGLDAARQRAIALAIISVANLAGLIYLASRVL